MRPARTHGHRLAIGALILGLSAPTLQAEPSFDPDSPNVELTPGSSLTIAITPEQSELLRYAEWTENNGALSRTKELMRTGDSIDYQVPTDARHCARLADELTVHYSEAVSTSNLDFSKPTTIDVTVLDPLELSPASASISGAPGSLGTVAVRLSGGATPYQAPVSANNAQVGYSDGVLSYRIPAGVTSSYTDTISFNGASDGDACGGNSASLSISVNILADSLVVSPLAQDLGERQRGETVEATFSLAGGLPPYAAELVSGPSGATVSVGAGSATFRYDIPSDATPGTTTATIKVMDSGDPSIQQSLTATVSFSVAAPAGPALSASPADITLEATSQVDLSNEITESFAVSGGLPPYALSVAGVSGGVVGRVEPARLSSAGTAQYRVDIPASTQSDLRFVNQILITDAAGTSVAIRVQANVTASNALSTLPGLTPNQRSVARAVESVCPRLASMPRRTADQEDLLTQCTNMLNNPRAAGIPETLEQITNEKANAARGAGIETGTQQLANIGSRLAALRAGARGIDFGSLAVNVDGETFSGSQLAALAASGGGASADETFGKWGFFLTGTLNFGEREKTNNETGFEYDSTAITGGADYRFSENFIAGGAFGYATHDLDFDSEDGGLDTETWHLAAYATSYLTERLYLDAILEYGWNDYGSKRNIDYRISSTLDAVGRQAEADFNGSQFGASLGAGYDINEGPVAYGVYGKVGYLNVDVDSYRERNAGGLNLEMDGFDATSVTTTLGTRISRVFNTERAVLIPQAKIEWEHEYDNDASTINARFAADPSGTRFTIDTDEPDRDYFRLGLGLSAVFPHGLSSFLNYSTLIDKRDWTDHMVDVGLRWEF
ncbi:autotransporter outer membrane beta-barrel domain-containing protein [Thiocystis violacea]|uniref:autotransporter family protein n=1 Tax=Thiocystis violacea TaxID=13725 RepID=UPI0019086FC2|nr:autotransporter outer membrane beta-barrel domain-containing protein [Thiocystis violacea]